MTLIRRYVGRRSFLVLLALTFVALRTGLHPLWVATWYAVWVLSYLEGRTDEVAHRRFELERRKSELFGGTTLIIEDEE